MSERVPDMSFEAACAVATGPEGPFPIVEEQIGGRPVPVFKNAPPSLRQLFSVARTRPDDTFLVYEDERWTFGDAMLVDTKFEFGFVDGELTIIDEVLTPDSSRYWDVNDWEPGNFPPAFDKQFLRAWLLNTDWKREPPPPELPDTIIEQTQERYLESYRRLSGKSLVL